MKTRRRNDSLLSLQSRYRAIANEQLAFSSRVARHFFAVKRSIEEIDESLCYRIRKGYDNYGEQLTDE